MKNETDTDRKTIFTKEILRNFIDNWENKIEINGPPGDEEF